MKIQRRVGANANIHEKENPKELGGKKQICTYELARTQHQTHSRRSPICKGWRSPRSPLHPKGLPGERGRRMWSICTQACGAAQIAVPGRSNPMYIGMWVAAKDSPGALRAQRQRYPSVDRPRAS